MIITIYTKVEVVLVSNSSVKIGKRRIWIEIGELVLPCYN